MAGHELRDGTTDIRRAVEELGARLPRRLGKLAELAMNYRWSWAQGGATLFERIAPHRWLLCGENPARLLREASGVQLARAADDDRLTADIDAVHSVVLKDLSRPAASGPATPERPVAFLCAEYGIHRSLPIYSGGLGALAGDVVKEASDLALPFVAVGLLYHQGYFHQRLDTSGWQHEYWTETDPDLLPAAIVTGEDGDPLTVTVPIRGRDVVAQIWRVDVGRVPLYLLDTRIPENNREDRWIASRLYVGDPEVRLSQYALLGIGAIRALRAMDITPSFVHLNEGHPALAPLELARLGAEGGGALEDALADARRRTIFTTHTPVAAGNETYSPRQFLAVLGRYAAKLELGEQAFLDTARIRPGDEGEPPGMTPLALRSARATNGVSRRHGEVARTMWAPLYEVPVDEVPIGHVTNGVHVPTWMHPLMRQLLDRYLDEGWIARVEDPGTWAAVDAIPDEELWAVRCRLRAELVEFVRDRSVRDRLNRGEPADYVRAAARALDADVLTVGFARRVATYKRLHLLTYDAGRALRLLDDPEPIQFLLAGKAHPRDDEAKGLVQRLFWLKGGPRVAERVVYLEDYDLDLAARLVAGCDVWMNLPRAPLEASGTSGMKSAMNGGLNLSVLDGWWAEAHDGVNGWAIPGDESSEAANQDARDAETLYRLMEEEVIPLFHAREADGLPRAWVWRVKDSLRSVGPRFSASRMVREYWQRLYPGA